MSIRALPPRLPFLQKPRDSNPTVKQNPVFSYQKSLSPNPHSRITNSLWKNLQRKSDSRVMTSLKSIMLVGLEYFSNQKFKLIQNENARVLNILITAGGTKEPMDDVRFITNFSTGSLGKAFANIAAWRGHNVTLLAPKEIEQRTGPLHPNVEHRIFTSTENLQTEILKAASENTWDLVLQSAAISDFTPANIADGKISSRSVGDELTIRLKKTPKLLAKFREFFGKAAYIVGYKLLSNMPDNERLKIALKQLREYETNLCFENDLSRITKTSHEARLVLPTEETFPVPLGDKLEVAEATLNFIEKQLQASS